MRSSDRATSDWSLAHVSPTSATKSSSSITTSPSWPHYKTARYPIHEKFLPELLERHRGRRLTFSGDLRAAVLASDVIFIAVGTPPTEEGHADLSYVETVARSIPSALNRYKVIIEKSTVPVYTSEWICKIILRNAAAPDSFDVASNPEFLREGTAVTDFLYPDRIVVGADSDRCAAVLREIYAPLTGGTYYQRPGCNFPA